MKREILITVDDSAASTQALEYIGQFFAEEPEVHFTLCHCVSEMAGPIPAPEDERNSLLPNTISQKKTQASGRCLNKAKAKLTEWGFDEKRVDIATLRGSNTANAILAYAEKELPDAIFIARRGVGLMGELLFGSVSSTLFEKSRTIPLWILDGAVKSKRILVPVDGTPPSLLAIDHLAHMFQNRKDVEFFLFHARSFLSPAAVCRPEKFYDKWGKEWCDIHLSGDGCMYTGPTFLLTEAGIPKENITHLPMPTAVEESTAIIGCARKNKCGTIVIGRRPESESKGFLGGVTRRTIKQTENMALWIIG